MPTVRQFLCVPRIILLYFNHGLQQRIRNRFPPIPSIAGLLLTSVEEWPNCSENTENDNMAKSIISLVPEAEDLLALEPEEVGAIVLLHLRSLGESEKGNLNRYNFSLNYTYKDYPEQCHKKIGEILMEGWMWLEREGFIAPRPEDNFNWYFITRRGMKVNEALDVDRYRKSNLLPKNQLHPLISQKVWATFLRGDYDTAVFQTFKEVEVAVRNAGEFTLDDIGAALMRKAFGVDGPLSDKHSPKAEQEALAHLFAGAIGSYKNPHSHRAVSIEAEEAVEMIMLGSHLLKIVDSRKGKNNLTQMGQI